MEKMTSGSQKLNKRTFRDYYNSMDNTPPKNAFIKRMATLTKRSESAVRSWIAGAYQPDALAQSVIEQHMGIPASVLFPQKEGETVCEQ